MLKRFPGSGSRAGSRFSGAASTPPFPVWSHAGAARCCLRPLFPVLSGSSDDGRCCRRAEVLLASTGARRAPGCRPLRFARRSSCRRDRVPVARPRYGHCGHRRRHRRPSSLTGHHRHPAPPLPTPPPPPRTTCATPPLAGHPVPPPPPLRSPALRTTLRTTSAPPPHREFSLGAAGAWLGALTEVSSCSKSQKENDVLPPVPARSQMPCVV